MTRLNKVHDLLDLIAAKERTGFFNPERKDLALDFAQMEYFKSELPAYGMNEVANECLTPFKRVYQVTNSNSPAGLVTLPAEYEYLTSIIRQGYDNVRNVPTYEEIEVINDDELGDRLRSQIRPVTEVKPVAQRIGNDDGRQLIQFYPMVPTALRINYLIRPPKPEFVYDLSGPDERTVTYKDGNSEQLMWKETDLYRVIMGALSFLGINLDEKTLIQYAQLKTAQT